MEPERRGLSEASPAPRIIDAEFRVVRPARRRSSRGRVFEILLLWIPLVLVVIPGTVFVVLKALELLRGV